MPRKPLSPGFGTRDLSASALNDAMDAGERQAESRPLPGPPPSAPTAAGPYLGVPCLNATGGALKERSIVGIKETAHTLAAIDVDHGSDVADAAVLAGEAVEVELPDTDKHTAGRWAVVLGPLGVDGSGFAVTAGLVKVRIDRTDAAHKFAKLKDGEPDYLESAESGVPVTWWALEGEDHDDDKEGMQWAQINLGSGAGGGSGNRQMILITETILAATVDDTPGENYFATTPVEFTAYPYDPMSGTTPRKVHWDDPLTCYHALPEAVHVDFEKAIHAIVEEENGFWVLDITSCRDTFFNEDLIEEPS